MSIVKMKRIRLIALSEDRDALLSSLLHVGCVEVSEPQETDEDYAALLHRDTNDLTKVKANLTELQHALDVLRKYAPQKEGMFAPRAEIREREFFDSAAVARAVEKAEQINEHAKAIGQLAAREARLNAEAMSLTPWAAYDLPLEEEGTRSVSVLLGTIPNAVDFDAFSGAVAEAAEESQVTLLSVDREQQYLEVLVHRSREQAALEAMRAFGFSFSQLKDMTGTVAGNLRRLDGEIAQVRARKEGEAEAIRAMGKDTGELRLCVDRVQQTIATESVKERLLTGGSILYLDGWVDAPHVPALEKALSGFDCAYELTDPTPEEYPQVPIKLENNPVTAPFSVITEMYSMPAYGSVDPNPLMAPFFILFFGFMMNDIGYGLLMVLGTAFFLKKAKPKGNTRNMMSMFFMCGISSIFWGCLTGSFFGDFIPKLFALTGVSDDFVWFWPPLFTPINDIILVMVGSMILGVIQVFTGMAVSMVEKFRHGQTLDAVTQEIAWYCILLGAALAIAGNMVAGLPAVLGTVGIAVLVLGAALSLAGSIIRAKSVIGVGTFLWDAYNSISGYFSDILSYLRLMALMMAGSIIASVFNTLGSVFGLVPFIIVALIGNILNLVLNLLGCYVHTMRLQCLEFFGRFYQDGGKPFRPLAVDTKYVDILKEEM